MTVQRLADLQNRIRSLGDLRDVVGAMRSLSAVRVQQAQETLLAIRQYASIVESALAEAAPRSPPASGLPSGDDPDALTTTAVVAFGSEHGFVGAFNDHVLDHAIAHLGRAGDPLLLVGTRAAMIAAERRRPIAWTCPMASHVGGVDEVALRTAEEIARRAAGELTRVVLVYTRCSGGATWRLVAETLLPFDVAPYLPRRRDKPPPISNLASKELFDKLVEELVFAQLTHAAMESFASESVARLTAMKSAHDNIEDKLALMTRLEREGRQEEITTELLDVITGAEAMAERAAGS
jgi:F-type H+-transporting ATPase subunit gamma